MENVSSFLQRFKKLLFSQGASVELVREVIRKELGAEIDPKNIHIKNNVVHVDAPPALKNTLFLKKKQILQTINETAGSKVCDIR